MWDSGEGDSLLTDQVGTFRAVADTSGAIVKRIDHDSFGNIIADSNPSFSVPFGFAGGLHDRDTGLVRFGYRDYSPELGRFVAKDPIDFAGGDTNLYAYVANDPVNFVDSFGLVLEYADASSDAAMRPYIKQIMTTADGRRLLSTLHKDPRKFLIHSGSGPGGPAYSLGNDVYMDPAFHPTISTDCGPKAASTPRILTHELGHLTGVGDDGPGRMNNVNTWENPIMFPLEGYKRTKY